jgi:hypothetical protein
MIKCCFFIPLGPSDFPRILWAIESIKRYSDEFLIYVLADRPFDTNIATEISATGAEIIWTNEVSKGHWGKIWLMQVAAMGSALRRQDLSDDCIFVKMDADALLVRNGMHRRARELFRFYPAAGIIGQCNFNISGHAQVNQGWANFFKKTQGIRGLARFSKVLASEGRSPLSCFGLWLRYRRIFSEAVRNGYRLGEFPNGGTYVIRPAAIKKVMDDGWLPDSPFRYTATIGDELIMTVQIYATGYRTLDDVGENGIFAICGKEPWIHPLDLMKRGHFVIHSTKYGVTRFQPTLTEEQLVRVLLRKDADKGQA